MRFIVLKKIDGPEAFTMVKADQIVRIETEDDATTWVELSTGTTFLVENFASDILQALGGYSVLVPNENEG